MWENHSGGIMSERWSNFFDLPSGCSANNGAAASCSGSMAQKNLDAEHAVPPSAIAGMTCREIIMKLGVLRHNTN